MVTQWVTPRMRIQRIPVFTTKCGEFSIYLFDIIVHNRDVHSMVEDCIVSPHNHLAEGDCCRDTKFQNGCLAFFQCCRWSHKHYRRKLNFEGTKDAAKFCETLFKITMWSFCWLNEIRLADYLQTNGQNNCNRMLSITKQIYNRIA